MDKEKVLKIIDYVIVAIQAALSIFLVISVRKLLPTKLLLPVVVLLLVLLLWIVLFLIVKKKAQLFHRIVCVLICIILALSCFAARKGLSALKDITDGRYETNIYSVVVLVNSDYNYIEDLDQKDVGYCTNIDEDHFAKVMADIETTTTINQVEYEDINSLQKSLFNKEVEAIIINEGYRGSIEEVNESFSEDTRVIYSFKITEAISNDTGKIDVTKDCYNIFISGIDTTGPVSTVSRSDVNMIVTVNPRTKTILLTSIPRDYYVPLATSGQLDKLTHAGIYGVNESIGTLENLFDIDIEYYARVNFTSLVTMVDALGGITIYNPEEFSTGDYTYAVGQISLDGAAALSYSRARYTVSGGDRGRIKNQQRVLQGMIEKALSPAIITNYTTVLDTISGSFETNMTSDEIQSLISMQLDDMTSWHFKTTTVDGTGTTSTTCYSMPGSELYVMEPDMTTVEDARKQINGVLGING